MKKTKLFNNYSKRIQKSKMKSRMMKYKKYKIKTWKQKCNKNMTNSNKSLLIKTNNNRTTKKNYNLYKKLSLKMKKRY